MVDSWWFSVHLESLLLINRVIPKGKTTLHTLVNRDFIQWLDFHLTIVHFCDFYSVTREGLLFKEFVHKSIHMERLIYVDVFLTKCFYSDL